MPNSNKQLKLFIPITKVDVERRLVYGTLSQEVVDSAGEILDYEGSKPAFEKWSSDARDRSDGKSAGNLRAMHGNIAAGKFIDIAFDDGAQRIEGCAKVVDENEWQKVLEGVYTGFSIGGSYQKTWSDPGNPNIRRYIPILAEVSLVDNPAVPTATFQVIKADGIEIKHFKEQTPMPAAAKPQVEQVWKARDGQTFAKREQALAHDAKLDVDEAVNKATAPIDAAMAALDDAVTKKSTAGNSGDEDAESGKDSDEETKETKKADDAGAAADDKPADEKKKSKAKFKTDKEKKADKAAEADRLEKGLSEVARAACIIQDLDWLLSCLEWEAEFENDGSPQPAKLESAMRELCEFLKDLVAEETSELFDGADDDMKKSVEANRLAKAGARHSKSDMEMLGKAHDLAGDIQKCMKDMGYGSKTVDDDAQKAAMAETLAKTSTALERSEAEKAELQKSMDATTTKLGDLLKRVEQIEATPAPAIGAKFAAITKSHEAPNVGNEPVETEFSMPNGLSPAEARQRNQR